MHIVNDAMYEHVFKDTRDVVRMAQAGKYKEGYLYYTIRCLEILKEAGKHLHRPIGEIDTLNKLIGEFRHEMTKPDEHFKMTPLEELHYIHGMHGEGYDNGNGNHNNKHHNEHEKVNPDPSMLGRNPH